ncbi:MAG: hypothetical protein MUF42_00855 [Cytophagaceae bacterium]|nr:hypothetical protein [Cytophagaceae bacterium]
MIFQSGLTIIVPVKDGNALSQLRTFLEELGKDPGNNPHVPFSKLDTIHYCRWFIIDQLRAESGAYEPPTLAFTSNYDGEVNGHLQDLMRLFEKGFDLIYQYCDGYPGASASTADKIKYLLSYQVENRLFWGAMRFYTVKELRMENQLRYALETFIDSKDFRKSSPKEVYQAILSYVENSEYRWALQPKEIPPRSWWIRYWGKLVLILAGLLVLLLPILPFLICWVLIGRYFEKRDDAKRAYYRKLGFTDGSHNVDELMKIENLQPQNQLTVYGTIKTPYWFKRTTLKLAIKLFKLNGTYRSTKGKLSGIETVHFARWVIFNNNQSVMFLSNYDGAWEKYLSEFIDHAANAMNLTFSNMIGYPQVKWMIKEGAHDEMLFKSTVRQNQYPTQVWYTAYPDMTVKNMLNNKRIRDGLSKKLNEKELTEWLKNF